MFFNPADYGGATQKGIHPVMAQLILQPDDYHHAECCKSRDYSRAIGPLGTWSLGKAANLSAFLVCSEHFWNRLADLLDPLGLIPSDPHLGTGSSDV